jgi:two-component sensor histidine kinase
MLTGWRYGLTCAALSGVVALTLLPELGAGNFPGAGSWTGFALFLSSSALIIVMADALRKAVLDLNEANRSAQTLNHELQHRVANTLTVVQALASQSARGATREDFVATFNGRVQALAKAHQLLGRRELTACTLPALVDEACLPFSTGANIVKSGPVCRLPPSSCVPLVLALHELCTNAVKYGALSNSEGRVELTWSFDVKSERATIMWNEVGGPVVKKPTRKGLGSALLRGQPGIAEVEHVFGANGVSCKLIIDGAVPLEEAGPGTLAVHSAAQAFSAA